MFPACFHSVITNISLKLKVASNVFAIGKYVYVFVCELELELELVK